MNIPIFHGKYHQHGGFSMAMLVYRGVTCRLVDVADFVCKEKVAKLGNIGKLCSNHQA